MVGPDASVHGVEGLFVVDASIMPDLPSANTNIPTIMLAEHIAARRCDRGATRSSERQRQRFTR